MKLLARVNFPDGVTPAEAVWPTIASRDIANRWLDTMERSYPGSTSELRQLCHFHGEEDVSECADCPAAVCAEIASETYAAHDAILCEACADRRENNAASECSCGSFCANCTGISACGPI